MITRISGQLLKVGDDELTLRAQKTNQTSKTNQTNQTNQNQSRTNQTSTFRVSLVGNLRR